MKKKINDQKGDKITVTIGDNAENIAAGKNIKQLIKKNIKITEKDVKTVHELFSELRKKIEIEAPKEIKNAAIERINELEGTILDKKPNLTTMENIKNWFKIKLPKLLGYVTSIFINPIVGKVVEAGGDIAVKELKERFNK